MKRLYQTPAFKICVVATIVVSVLIFAGVKSDMAEKPCALAAFIVFLLAFVIVGWIGILTEWHKWNHGICRKNQKPWKHFDSTYSGDRGYEAGEECCWISWPGIDYDR